MRRLLTNSLFRMRNRFILKMMLSLFLIFACSLNILTQEGIKGTITDNNGNPVIGATVVIKGTSIGTSTDINGSFAIQANEDDTLEISSIGFESQEIKIEGGITTINVTLQAKLEELDEVVVIGYGTQRKEDLTSAVASVKSENFTKGSVKSAGQLLQGKVAGLAISNVSGDPNGDVEILLRGQVSLYNANSSPLIVIDGVPGMSLSMVAPEDIESMDILKDGSAAAIYGTRANTGVILITTKKGKMGAKQNIKVNIHSYLNYDMINRRIEMLNADEFTELIESESVRDLLINNGKESLLSTADLGYNTDWIGELMENQLNHSQHISVQSGNENSSIIGSVTYRNLDGIWLKSGKNSLRSRLNYSSSVNDKLLFDFNILNEIVEYQNFDQEAFRQALYRNPTDRIYDDNGEYIERENVLFYYNPVSMINERIDEGKSNRSMFSGKASIEPLSGFTLSTQISYQHYSLLDGYASTFKHLNTWNAADSVRASRETHLQNTKNIDITGEYKKIISMHSFSVLAGYSYYDNTWEGFSAFNTKFPTDVFGYNNIGIGKGEGLKKGMSSYKGNNKLIAFFGRLNYNYNNKYLFSTSIRREGSTKFGKDNKWGNFWAFSGGWRISNEPFFNIDFINYLKLRAGYGITGAEPDESYLSQLTFEYLKDLYNSGNQFYYNGKYIVGVSSSRAPNPDLGWEKKAETNFGLDMGILNNRIEANVNFFIRKTSDLLWRYEVPVPPNFASTIMANVGEIQNTGIEIELYVTPIKKHNFDWSVSLNFATNNNKILSLSNDKYKLTNDYIPQGYAGNPINATNTHRAMIDERIGMFWGKSVEGIDEEGNWIYKNLNGDTTSIGRQIINDEDEHNIGNGSPKYFAGLSNSIRYKNIDFSFSLRGAFAFQVLNLGRVHYQPLSSLPSNLSVYAKEKPFNDMHIYDGAEYNDYYIEDGDFIKVDNIDLGYTFHFKQIYKASIRIYVSANNFFMFTKYTGLDPEVSISGITPGIDNVGFGGVDDYDPENVIPGSYPSVKSVTCGININF